jgi:tetratricopeptide (TPR) repeat protein
MSVDATHTMGRKLASLDQHTEADEWFQKAYELAPTNERMLLDWAICKCAMGDFDSGEHLFSQVQGLAPDLFDPKVSCKQRVFCALIALRLVCRQSLPSVCEDRPRSEVL